MKLFIQSGSRIFRSGNDLYKNQSGMSFTEIIIVIGLISILSVTAMNSYMGATDTAQRAKVVEDLNGLSKAVKFYLIERPDPVSAFRALRDAGSIDASSTLARAGRLSSGEKMLDPWGHHYTLHSIIKPYSIVEFYIGSVSPEMNYNEYDKGFYSVLTVDWNDGVPSAIIRNVPGYWVKIDEAREL